MISLAWILNVVFLAMAIASWLTMSERKRIYDERMAQMDAALASYEQHQKKTVELIGVIQRSLSPEPIDDRETEEVG